MYLNDHEGDCTAAGAANITLTWAKETGLKEAVTDDAVQAFYNLSNGGQDNGAVESVVLQNWQKIGLQLANGTYDKIKAFCPVSTKSKYDLLAATWLFGGAYVGAIMPQSAIQQFEAGQPWDLTDTGEQLVGGHAFPFVGYDKTYIYVVTWGKVQPVTWRWWLRWGEEAWAVLPNEFAQIGHGVTGDTLAQLQQAMDDLATDAANYWGIGQ